jgi:hypothetical protein
MDSSLNIFFASPTDVGDYPVPQSEATPHHRGVSNWELQRVARPGQPADNEPWPAHPGNYVRRGQVWITRLGTHTRVVLLADQAEPAAEEAPISDQHISDQNWA